MPDPVHLAGLGRASIVETAFAIISVLFALCRLWRCWAAARTYVAYQAALREQLALLSQAQELTASPDIGRP
jgi:hypothetical protein